MDDIEDDLKKLLKPRTAEEGSAELPALAASASQESVPPTEMPKLDFPRPDKPLGEKPRPVQPRPDKPRPTPSPRRLDELPLFETNALDELLKAPEPQNEPLVVPAPASANSRGEFHGGATRVVDFDAIVLTRLQASLVLLGGSALLAGAFALGYMLGK
jgi:hypothetical protein